MLPKINRLTKKRDFVLVKGRGKRFQGKLFALLVLPTENVSFRVGFIVSTRISKKAVERNKAKRLLREAIKSLLLQTKTASDLLFLARKEIVGQSLTEVKKEMEELLKKASLLK